MKSIVICGKKQSKNFTQKNEKERLQSPSYRDRVPSLVHEHFDRIRKADVCYVYNKGGYLGINTTLELGFAHGKNMVIYALEPEKSIEEGGEVCRDILFTEIIDNPEELVKRLV